MAVAAIAIGNLTSPALYVSSFHAELFSDSNYTQLVGSKSCAAVQDGNGNWIQADLIGFNGLVRGQTYYIQAGPVSPGGVANFNRYSVQAGTLTIPACTYTGTFSTGPGGITYDITPESVPSDIDHFEAIWTKDGTAPTNDSLANYWSGHMAPNGVINLFVSGTAGQTVELFMRGVSTSGGYQNWYAVDNRTIQSFTSGTTDASGIRYADGTTVEALKPAQAGANVTQLNTAADTSAVNGINAGHVADTATSVGFLGKWWRMDSTTHFPAGGGEPVGRQIVAITHDAQINYNIWQENSWPGAIVGPPWSDGQDGKYLYIRWTGYFVCDVTGTYAFGTNSDDGANLFVNGTQLVSDLTSSGHAAGANLTPQHSGTINLTAGETYEVIVEYFNIGGAAGIQVVYTPPGGSGWQLLNLGTAYKSAAFTTYSDGTVVDALKPAAAGADVTAINVSRDTSAVGGRSAADVASTVLSGGGTDYLHSGNVNLPQNANNLLVRGSFEDGQVGSWGGGSSVVNVTGQNFTKALQCVTRDTVETANTFQVTPGQRIYCSGAINTQGSSNSASFGLILSGPGGAVTWVGAFSVAAGTGWTQGSGYITIPSGYTSAQGWVQIPVFSNYGTVLVANLFYTKTAVVDFSETTHVNKNAENIPYSDGTTIESLKPAQAGSDVTGENTALNTQNVGSTPASVISSVVPNGYKLIINSGSRTYSLTAV